MIFFFDINDWEEKFIKIFNDIDKKVITKIICIGCSIKYIKYKKYLEITM